MELIVLVLVIAAVADLARSVLGGLSFPSGYVRPALIGGAAVGIHFIGGWGLVAGLAWLVLLATTWGGLGFFSALNALHLAFPAHIPLPHWRGTAFAFASTVIWTLIGCVVSLGGLFKVGWYWAGMSTLSSALCITAIGTLVIPHVTSAARAKREAKMAALLSEIGEGEGA
jgi:hypothetical protein